MGDKPAILGIDVGATGIKGTLFSPNFEIIADLGRRPTEADLGPEQAIAKMAAMLLEARPKWQGHRIALWGGNIPGPARYGEGRILRSPNLGPTWDNFGFTDALCAALNDALGYSVPGTVANDVAAAAFGEQRFGVGGGTRSVYLAAVGGGVGGGFADASGLYKGARHVCQNHIGHVYVVDPTLPYAPLCGCGKRGHMEAFTSFTSMFLAVDNVLARNAATCLKDEWATTSNKGKSLMDAAKAGDAVARQILEVSAHYLAIALHNAAMEFEPDVLAVGGGVTYYEPYIGIVAREVDALFPETWTVLREETQVVFAQLKNNAGRVGGAALAMEKAGMPLPTSLPAATLNAD
jgi:glucokinase